MSKIPSGLTGASMRERMEDKATIKHVGGLYIGGAISKSFVGGDDSASGTTAGKETEELYPGAKGLALISNGSGQIPSFQPLTSVALLNGSVKANNLGEGCIVIPSNYYRHDLTIEGGDTLHDIYIAFLDSH